MTTPDTPKQAPSTVAGEAPSLLPCPFCGETNISFENARDFLACMSCGVEGPCYPGQGSTEAIAAWNRRAPAQAAAPQGEALEAVAWQMPGGGGYISDRAKQSNGGAEWPTFYTEPLCSLTAAQARIAALTAKVAELERDAARYRALRGTLQPVKRGFSDAPRLLDPFRDDVGYNAEGLDIACDFMVSCIDAACHDSGGAR